MRRKADVAPEHRTTLNGFLRNEDGISAIVFAIFLPVLVGTAALAIDMGYAYSKRTDLQTTASAAALAGAGIAMDGAVVDVDGTIAYTLIDKDGDGVPDSDDSNSDGVIDGAVVLNEAQAYAEKNIAGEAVLATLDVLPGNWEPATRIFTRSGTWDPATQVFVLDPAAYDSATGTWTAVTDPVTPMNAVMATTRRAADGPNDNALPLFLASAVGMTEININTTALATIEVGAPPPLDACITALNRTEDKAFYINGTATIEAPGCNIDVYSTHYCAIRAVGIPVISVIDGESLDGDGRVRTANSGGTGTCDTPNVNWFPDEGPVGGLAPATDIPFGYLYPPGSSCIDGDYCGLVAVGTPTDDRPNECDGTEPSLDFHAADYDADGVLYIGTPGTTTVYCGGVSFFGPTPSEVLFAGNIVISGGELEVAAQVGISSPDTGVGFYLMDGARIDMHGGPGNEGVGLVAQDSGPLTNFIFFEDPNSVLPDNGGDSHHSLRGTPLGAYDGILFFQNSDIEFKGTADALLGLTGDDCSILIADEIYFNGTTQFSADARGCSGDIPPIGLGELTLRLRN